jgi:hypothetical protein
MRYPPFTRLTTVLFKGPDEAAVDACSKDFAEKLKPRLPPTVRASGPAPAAAGQGEKKPFPRAAPAVRAVARSAAPACAPFSRPTGAERPSRPPTVDALSLM